MIKLIWSTENADAIIGYVARVSNPANQNNPDVDGLLRYCARNGHWSVFEQANACLEINTTRDIARQILRHRSLSFAEFSQRYQDASKLGDWQTRECRLQDNKNRQSSLETDDQDLINAWRIRQETVIATAMRSYQWALEKGIAKEQARALLPEGLTPSRIYANGTFRSWIHYLQSRLDKATQKEHRLVAEGVLKELYQVAPVTIGAFFPEQVHNLQVATWGMYDAEDDGK